MNVEALLALFSLRGRVALLTGASGGIGQALASGLAMAGASVALSGRSSKKLQVLEQAITAQGGLAQSFVADLHDPCAVESLVSSVTTAYGGIDILINCAGANQRMPIEQMTPPIYDRIMSTNLRSVYFLSQAVLPVMTERGGGKVIHIGSLTSAIGIADVSVYGMTKSALAQLTKTMAVEWAEHNIQVNCLCPGFIATELTLPLWDNPQRNKWMIDRLPIKRAGTPEDLVGLMLYLASPASNYTTGQTIYVDGGFLAGSQW